MRSEFLLQKGALVADMLFCLRAASTESDCRICANVCPDNAIWFKKNEITIANTCSECTLCVGECPSEAISFFDTDILSFLANSKQTNFISCSGFMPCLGMLSLVDLLILSLQNQKNTTLDLSKCDECSFFRASYIKDTIKKRVDKTNNFLSGIKRENISLNYKKAEKRELFRRGSEFIKKIAKDEDIEKIDPKKLMLLKKLLQEIDVDIELPFGAKIEVHNNCTLCQDCSFFCPTNALSLVSMEEQKALVFDGSRCLGCDICESICKSHSVIKTELKLKEFTREENIVLIQKGICKYRIRR